ncbi:hypothetical protein [Lichenifustis flavocetrariae]|uniref:Uncharacterized protein n=1 Tax=Lichenifustis flavocetrariae TaxID=2949735 RepID=A0AA42CMS3_9HYPH|nr:hypothetical protein [Lichenifustis flavocetrariae]MCW6508660.1 hypothetical protein [Lichenifustis flavocetrariae]
MTKRPRLSQNLRPPLAEGRDTASQSPRTEIAPPGPEIEVAQAQPMALPPSTPRPAVSLPPGREPDTLPRIFGDAMLALSLASTFAWTQGLMLQLRLSGHLMSPPREDHPAR